MMNFLIVSCILYRFVVDYSLKSIWEVNRRFLITREDWCSDRDKAHHELVSSGWIWYVSNTSCHRWFLYDRSSNGYSWPPPRDPSKFRTNSFVSLKALFVRDLTPFDALQSLFYSALRCSREMLSVNDSSNNLVRAINNRLSALSFHIREYYWVDIKKINEIYRYKTEEYSTDATNKFNIYPEQIPPWLMDWIPEQGGYLLGNLQPAHMDFRFFTLGNFWSVVSSLSTPKQNEAILNLIEAKWDDIIGHMPLKICYPALEYDDWRIITGSDPKNTWVSLTRFSISSVHSLYPMLVDNIM